MLVKHQDYNLLLNQVYIKYKTCTIWTHTHTHTHYVIVNIRNDLLQCLAMWLFQDETVKISCIILFIYLLLLFWFDDWFCARKLQSHKRNELMNEWTPIPKYKENHPSSTTLSYSLVFGFPFLFLFISLLFVWQFLFPFLD